MKQIVKYVLLKKRISYAQGVNAVLYFIRSLPLVGKKIPEKVYTFTTLKTILALLGLCFSIMFMLFTKVCYVLLVLILPVKFILQDKEGFHVGVLLVFFIIRFAGSFINVTTKPTKKDYVALRLLHMKNRPYVFSTWIMHYGLETIVLAIACIACFTIFQIPIWYAFVMILFYEGTTLLAERIHIQYAMQHEVAIADRAIISVFIIGLFVLAYGSVFMLPNIMILEVPLLVLMLGIGILSLWLAIPYLLHNVDYTLLMSEGLLRQQKYILNNPMNDALLQSVTLHDNDYKQEDFQTMQFANKQGYEYLNALFFQRHARLLRRPMLKRVIGIIVCFLCIDVLVFFIKDLLEFPNQLFTLFSPLLMLLYFLSLGEKITRAMFYNCDVSLLRYGYYRQADAILANFKIRLRKIIQMNLLLALLICIGFMSLIIVSTKTYELLDQMLFYSSIISVAIFFSVHHLVLYYVLQPYTGETGMISPMYNVINTIVYMVCYAFTMFEITKIFVIGVLIITLLYSLGALILVHKVAPKTFHIK